MEVFLGIDLGASALKACLIGGDGKTVARARADYATAHPQPGMSEQNPADWRAALLAALGQLAKTTDLEGVQAISFSGGAHIGVLCDGDGAPLHPAIMWSDQRAHEEAAQLAADGKVAALAGNAPNATWTLPQLIWLKTHKPNIIAATQKLFFAKDWMAAQLTGAHVSDASEAVGSLMSDLEGNWHDDLTAMSGLTPAALPKIIPIGAQAGTVSDEAAAAFGLPRVPVYQGAIDTSMEWLCAAPLDKHTATLKLASAGVISFTTAAATRFPPVSYYPHVLDGLSYHAAGMSDCMGALDFVRTNFTPKLDARAFETAAAHAPAGADGVFFFPFLSGARAPFWDAALTAEMRGLTRAHDQSAIARAAYEGVGHVLSAIWHDMTDKLGHRPDALHLLGGGGHSDFFCQMLADMLGVTLRRGGETDCAFATALFAAAVHRGEKPDLLAHAAYAANGQFTPDKAAHSVYARLHEGFMARFADSSYEPSEE
ncbi:MAG: hypothetical protein ISQ19_02035 [PS1 clade bacterium]|uniref:Carbohydrate kinase n=1 Tax=PS1 clade bacterium TaxID=2175152 RepID=A0A937L2K6_9PROT|nr:hypothetical protein [PS1 clade bacterium]